MSKRTNFYLLIGFLLLGSLSLMSLSLTLQALNAILEILWLIAA